MINQTKFTVKKNTAIRFTAKKNTEPENPLTPTRIEKTSKKNTASSQAYPFSDSQIYF